MASEPTGSGGGGKGGEALQGGGPAEASVVLFMASVGDHLSGRKWHIVGSAGGLAGGGGGAELEHQQHKVKVTNSGWRGRWGGGFSGTQATTHTHARNAVGTGATYLNTHSCACSV